VSKSHIDILTAHFVLRPHTFSVVVGSNLFGDILSDLGPACTGTIGIAPSANLNPSLRPVKDTEGRIIGAVRVDAALNAEPAKTNESWSVSVDQSSGLESTLDLVDWAPSLFEPVHGSAPDIAGKGIANPIGMIWAGQMMLNHLGEHSAAALLMRAIENVVRKEGGGGGGSEGVGNAEEETGVSDILTPDMGGRGATQGLGRAVEEEVWRLARLECVAL